ncbi:hypothetical protein NL676_015674 [Syzygium grande]|nr:hypothetical protein NL676_015674 [Syzygium grande]
MSPWRHRFQARILGFLDGFQEGGLIIGHGDERGLAASDGKHFSHVDHRDHVAPSHEREEENVKLMAFTTHFGLSGEFSATGTYSGMVAVKPEEDLVVMLFTFES